MKRLSDRKIIIVTRPTRLEDLVRRFNTVEQARFFVEHRGGEFSDIENEDARYQQAIDLTENLLESIGLIQRVPRPYLPTFTFGPLDIVVVLGQDGLVANTVKYLSGQPVIGVNPDPDRWMGQLLPFEVTTLKGAIMATILNESKTRKVTLARATLNDGQEMLAVNDLFIGPKSHTSALYNIEFRGREEQQSSSGIIVSTGVGSTGWLKSIMTGAVATYEKRIKASSKNSAIPDTDSPWDAARLEFNVREPFPTRTTGASIVHGSITPERILVVTSRMAEHGVIFSDGIESDFLEFNSGSEVSVSIAEQKGNLVI